MAAGFVPMVFELGVAVCHLVYLFSLRQTRPSTDHQNLGPDKDSAIGLAFMSLATTFVMLVITVVGVTKTLDAVRRALTKVRETAISVSRARQHSNKSDAQSHISTVGLEENA
jgi:hypothetical protein